MFFKDREMSELQEEFSDSVLQDYVERLSEYMESTGREYKSHAATIRRRRAQGLQAPYLHDFTFANDSVQNPPDLAHARIYDRIMERCAPILFLGKNFREKRRRLPKRRQGELSLSNEPENL